MIAKDLGDLPEERGLYVDANVLEIMVYFGMLKDVAESVRAD